MQQSDTFHNMHIADVDIPDLVGNFVGVGTQSIAGGVPEKMYSRGLVNTVPSTH